MSDKNSGRKNHLIIVTLSLLKSSVFQHVFRAQENEKPAFKNSSGLKSVFEKLRLRDGVVWTVGLPLGPVYK